MDQKERRERQLRGILEDAIECACTNISLEEDAIERLLRNAEKLQEDLAASIIKHSVEDVKFFKHSFADVKFFLMDSFELTVPEDYDHGRAAFELRKTCEEGEILLLQQRNYDKHYKNATHQLVPGKTYMVKIFSIRQEITPEDCMNFLALQRAIPVGVQGLSLARQLKREKFPIGKWTVSFNEKDAIWEDADGNRGVPRVGTVSDGVWRANPGGCFGSGWVDGSCLLCFCDLPVGEAGK